MERSIDVKWAHRGDLSSPRKGSRFDFSGIHETVMLENCYITKDSLILDKDKNPIKELHDEHVYWEGGAFQFSENEKINQNILAERQHSLFTKEFNQSTIVNFDCDTPFVYLMHPFRWYAYGHLFDSLQRLFCLKDSVKSFQHLIISDARRISDFNLHVESLGYSVNQLFHFPYKVDMIRVKKLIFSYSPATLTQFTQETITWIRSSYFRRINSQSTIIDTFLPKDFCLLLDRSGVGRRLLLNQDEVISCISSRGIPVIRLTGSESLHEALYLFSKAKYIVGPHGAMFVNTIFAREDASIVELCPTTRRVSMMLRMCKPCRNHSLSFWRADSNLNIVVNPLEVLDLLFAFNH